MTPKSTQNTKKHINSSLFKNDTKERVVADYIAGMTDRYADLQYKLINE